MENVPQKRCSICQREFPATVEYFHRDPHVKCGLRSRCKQCQIEYAKQYREKNGEYVRAGEKRYRDTHVEEMRKKGKRQRKEYQNDTGERHERYKAKMRRHNMKRRQTHRDEIRTRNRNRKAKIKAAQGKHTANDIRAQYKRQKGRCYWCNIKVGDSFHVDHVIPLDHGGSNGPDNLVISCAHCNTSKGNKLPHEWKGNGGKLL